jgi:DNA (cytosine-5)-methyltransferase 1
VKTTIYAADLFAGAGGASLGLARTCAALGYELDLVAVNHWDVAVATHLKNFPAHVHHCAGVDAVNPLEAVPGGYLDLLMAGPECTHFSRARGGKPKKKQSRASAFDIIHWLETLYVQNVLIENVKEFLDWGPLDADGKVIPALKGRDFRLFVGALEELGYTVRWRVQKSCDFGDPTSRERLFVQATRGGEPSWPVPSHVGPKLARSFPERKPWRTARECIDWSLKGTSIYRRKEAGLQPLAENTLKRIFAGVRKFSGLPFIVPQFGGAEPRSADRPLGTVTTTSRGIGIAQPLLVVFRNNCDGASIDAPLGTVCTGPHMALCQFLAAAKNEAPGQFPRTHGLDVPMPTVVADGRPGDLVESFLTLHYGGHDARTLDAPLQTVAANYEHFGLVEPVPPFLVRYNGGSEGRERAESLDGPVTTLDTSNRFALCEFVVEYHGEGQALTLADPLRTVTGTDRFGLVELVVVGEKDGYTLAEGRVVGWVDILFRMLQPHELAAAQGFPEGYEFTGNREQQVAQIGNAWTGNLAMALTGAILRRPKSLVRPVPDFSPLHATWKRQLTDLVFTASEAIKEDVGLFDGVGVTA